MKRLFIVFIILVVGIVESSCSWHGLRLSPLTEKEKQDLGTIGIASTASSLDALHKRPFSAVAYGMRETRDRLVDIGEGALKGGLTGLIIASPLGRCHRESCLLKLTLATASMTVGVIAGGIDGALNRKTYSDPPEEDHPDKAAYQAVQESIDDLGLPAKLRDKIWEKVHEYPGYKFDLVPKLPSYPQQATEETHGYLVEPAVTQVYGTKWSQYWPLRDMGIRTLFKINIPFVEFRGSGLDQPYQLIVPVETTLFNTSDLSCVRQRLWEYRGGSHSVAEWNENEAKLFREELDRFFDLVAKRVTSTFFGKESDLTLEERTDVIPKMESLDCVG